MKNLGWILPITFLFGSISWRFIIGTIFLPQFKSWTTQQLLKPLVSVHLFRYVSLSLLIPGLTTANDILPKSHIIRLASWDVICAILAMLVLVSIHKAWKSTRILLLLLSVVGLGHLLMATIFDIPLFIKSIGDVDARLFGVLTTFIPLVFVSHIFIIKILWLNWNDLKNHK